jgi:hypothetical protein
MYMGYACMSTQAYITYHSVLHQRVPDQPLAGVAQLVVQKGLLELAGCLHMWWWCWGRCGEQKFVSLMHSMICVLSTTE